VHPPASTDGTGFAEIASRGGREAMAYRSRDGPLSNALACRSAAVALDRWYDDVDAEGHAFAFVAAGGTSHALSGTRDRGRSVGYGGWPAATGRRSFTGHVCLTESQGRIEVGRSIGREAPAPGGLRDRKDVPFVLLQAIVEDGEEISACLAHLRPEFLYETPSSRCRLHLQACVDARTLPTEPLGKSDVRRCT